MERSLQICCLQARCLQAHCRPLLADSLLAGSLIAETLDEAGPLMGCKERENIFIYIKKEVR